MRTNNEKSSDREVVRRVFVRPENNNAIRVKGHGDLLVTGPAVEPGFEARPSSDT